MYNVFDATKTQKIPDKDNVFAKFLTDDGLYKSIEVTSDNIQQLIDLIAGEIRIDCYCKECETKRIFVMEPIKIVGSNPKGIGQTYLSDQLSDYQHRPCFAKLSSDGTTFEPVGWSWYDESFYEHVHVMKFCFKCGMSQDHALDFILRTEGNFLVKIGQFPSIADLARPELIKYRKILSKEDSAELRRAIGLHAQGIGIGSYTYLRRILERIVDKAKAKAISDGKINLDEYTHKKVADRIKMLTSYLPDVLVKNSTVYGIISKGIHELSEDECIEYFPVLLECIYMILEKWEQERKQAELEKQLASKLSKITSMIK